MQAQEIFAQSQKQSIIGSPFLRVEDGRFLIGSAKYVEDIALPNLHHLVILRSTYPHAKLKKVDVSDALKLSGVSGIFTGNDIKKISKPIYHWYNARGLKSADIFCLASEKVRYVGDPIAAVVVSDRGIAKDALDLISVDYDPLIPVVKVDEALANDAPLLYEEWGTNVMLEHELGGGNVEEAFRQAHRIIEADIGSHRYSASPLEARAYSSVYDPPNLTVWASTQQPHQVRTIIARTIDFPEGSIRVIEPDIGGGFGAKQPTYPEEILVPLLAKNLRIPLLFFEERKENLTSMHQAREVSHHIAAAVDQKGLVLGVRDRIRANLGAYLPTCGPGSVIIAGKSAPGAYKIRNYKAEILGVTTNKAPYGALRGYGKDSGNFAIERMMDIIAYELGLDPIEVRLRNIVKPSDMPYRSVTGALYDSGDYPACLAKAATLISYYDIKRKKKELNSNGKAIGVGISLTVEPTGSHYPGAFMLGYEGATVRIEPSGEITVLVGSASMGTGHETMVSQIVAQELGLRDLKNIRVFEGDTRACSFGFGTWASRTTVTTGNAVLLAIRDIKEKILRIASQVYEANIDDLRMCDGKIVDSRKPSTSISIKDIASIAYAGIPRTLPSGMEPGLESTRFYLPPNIEHIETPGGGRNTYAAYTNSAHAAVVEVDLETGEMKVRDYLVITDCGRAINPMIIEGQIVGGVVQGIGGAIYEENLYSEEGEPLATTFGDYLLPTSMEAPNVRVRIHESPSPFNPLGAKGVGEGPIEGVPATLTCALEDALSHLGVQVRGLPLSPEKVWKMIRSEGNNTSKK